ncbi:MAG: TonB-dependent siderophore receptor [Pseudorhodobacter sp.]|nr:TonB-dependent siderophore receptor [Rhizobacter sp.]
MAHTHFSKAIFQLTPAALGAFLLTSASVAQTTLEAVTVTGRAVPSFSLGGWGDTPLAKSPFQASIISAEQMRERGVQRLADLTRIDPSVSDAYNTEGYWDYLTVRGFVIDNRFNYRRDGLPINAETRIALDNKDRVEILKGTSGLQAGTSAPGGLVNFVVKRPTDLASRSAFLGWQQNGSLTGAVDISQRFGASDAFGLRLNAAAERLDPPVRDAKGNRHLLALAGDWRLSSDTLLEAEFETSHRSQPSVPGFSLLGSVVPKPDLLSYAPRINLNNQPWSLPVVLDGNTASIRLSQKLAAGWRATLHAATQQLTSQDRVAFPYGCSAENNYDRYCSDGTFDLYDFRSDNEKRRIDALEATLNGAFQTGGFSHAASVGVLRSTVRQRFEKQAYNYVGSGNVQGTAVTPADPTLGDENTNRDETSTEFFLRDAVKLSDHFTAWLGLRHTALHRESVRTNGKLPTAYDQSVNTPSVALSYTISSDAMAYASWGKGVESEVAPNRARYTNRGAALPALQSRQVELGLKGNSKDFGWSVAWFDINRPAFADVGSDCNDDTTGNTCTRQADGSAHHRGIEGTLAWRQGTWAWQGGAQWLQARREGSVNTLLNGLQPTNVPAATLKLQGTYDVASLTGLSLSAALISESKRMVLEDNSVSIPGYSRVDASLRFENTLAGKTTLWRAGLDNVLNRRAWKESPLQFGHAYLFPLAPRTLRLSVDVAL